MSTVEQIYCTHCTTEAAAFGSKYTARAGSLEPRELQQCYLRAIDRLLIARNYHPPRDTPRAFRGEATADEMPARLVYIPEYHGYRMLGQVCYRQRDSTGVRIGSYFAHFLFAKAQHGAPWRALDCLRMWDSPTWVREDDPAHPKKLETIASWRGLLPDPDVAPISEQVLISFLTAEVLDACYDPGHVIPVDLASLASAPARQQLLESLLQGFLELSRTTQESLLLVADPDFAALLFFGVLRLVPPTVLGDAISFSTFETELRTLPTTLVATTFYDPSNTDLTEEERSAAAFVVNVFRMAKTRERAGGSKYARLVVQTLVQQGWAETDRLLARIEEVQAAGPEELESLAAAHELGEQLLAPHSTPLSKDSLSQPETRGYLRLLVRDRLIAQPVNAERVARSHHISDVLELLFEHQDTAAALDAADRLIPLLHDEFLLDELRNNQRELAFRVRLLTRYVTRKGQLPVQEMAGESAESASHAGYLEALLPDFVRNSTARCLEELFLKETRKNRIVLLQKIAVLASDVAHCREAICRIVLQSAESVASYFDDLSVSNISRGVLQQRVVQNPASETELRRIAASANILLVLRLLAGDDQGAMSVARTLADYLTDDVACNAITDESLPRLLRQQMLANAVRKHRGFPEPLRELLYQAVAEHRPAQNNLATLVREFLDTADADTLHLLYAVASKKTQDGFLSLLLSLGEKQRERLGTPVDTARQAIARISADWDKRELWTKVLRFGDVLVLNLPEKRIAAVLQRQLDRLRKPENMATFDLRIDYLQHLIIARTGNFEEAELWIGLRDKILQRCNRGRIFGDFDAARDVISLFNSAFPDEVGWDNRRRLLMALLKTEMKGIQVPNPIVEELLHILVRPAIQKTATLLDHDYSATIPTPYPREEPFQVKFSFPKYMSRAITIRLYLTLDCNAKFYPTVVRTVEAQKPVTIPLKKLGSAALDVGKFKRGILRVEYEFHSQYWKEGEEVRSRAANVILRDLIQNETHAVLLKDAEGRLQTDQNFFSGLLNKLSD